MLQREGFVVSDMSASTSSPSPLQRSSWKAEAIRRGNLKISGPIPITEDVPLNDEEEKEFAENGALDRTLQPQDAPEDQYERPQTPPRPMHSPPPVPEQHMSALRSNPVGEQSQRDDGFSERPNSSRSPPQVRHLNEVQRESVVPSTSIASPTPFRSTPESATKAAQKKKRKSGLRNVFRKMFGRKSLDRAEDPEEEPIQRGHSYHHSDPTMLRSTPPRGPRTPPSGQRISELPVEELQPLHPLGQHLPYPMNVNAPPASPPKEYLTFDVDRPDLGRRRATLPTVPSAITHRHSLDEPREKLAAWDEKAEEEEISPGIGIALSSPTHTVTSRHDRRRSRSADALHSLVKERASTERGRSAEIKYWRESYMSSTIYSRPHTAKTVETVRTVPMQEPMIRGPDNESFNEMSATLVQADDSQTPTPITEEPRREQERDVQPAVSAFNFGDLKNAMFGPKEEAIPESPQVRDVCAPPPPPAKSQHRLPIEDRVQDLESKYSSLETLTRRMSSRNNRQTIILENAPRTLRSRNRSSSASASASRSHSRSAPSIHQEPIIQSSSETLDPEPAPASPTLAVPSIHSTGSNEENVRALRNVYEALRHERSARKALEQQVRSLQHDVSDLHALVNKLITSATATSPSYPTPSPDTLINSSEGDQRISCSTPRAPTHDRNVVYGHDREQRWDNDDASVYSEDVARKPSYDDVATPDVWATPKEEGFGGSGFFHSDDKVRGYA